MSSRHSSICCDAPLKQIMMFKKDNKTRVLSTKEFVKLRAAETSSGNWFNVPGVIWRYHCTNCGKIDNGKWEFKHDRELITAKEFATQTLEAAKDDNGNINPEMVVEILEAEL